MRVRAGYCPCALYRGRARIVRRAALGPSDGVPSRALDCYYIALSAELFEGFPNIDWSAITSPTYARRWVRHLLSLIPHPRIVYRRLLRCRDEFETLQFEEYFDLARSIRSARAVAKRRGQFEKWAWDLEVFLERAEEEIKHLPPVRGDARSAREAGRLSCDIRRVRAYKSASEGAHEPAKHLRAMTGILCESFMVLRSLVLIHDPELDCHFNTYLASSLVDGHYFAFSVAQPLRDEGSPLQPHGGTAEVHGTLTVYKKSLLFSATSVLGVHLPSDKRTRHKTRKLFHPTLHFVGKVKHVYPISLRTPTQRTIDVAVDCDGVWPYEDTVLKCHFNLRERRFETVALLEPDMSISISGELLAWEDGKLSVDVHDASPNNEGELPGRLLATLPNLFEKLGIMNDFAVFNDPCSLPLRAGLPASLRDARTASAQWLEIVAGVPANESSDEAAEASGSSTVRATAATVSTLTADSTAASGYVARRAVGRSRGRARRAVAAPLGRSPLSEIDVNIPAVAAV
ncbi:hypothetical protein AURDEDRAFT_170122 [Auricularia subglabra TFB-10046 SS5]|nr:hypothetical protein AURDEDRAFT_170122 [Auricularia subglabra TFB-10046 SS5]